jgi:GNAT superfamily N-acetyltransferase
MGTWKMNIRQATIDDVNDLSDLISDPSSIGSAPAADIVKRKHALFMLMDNVSAIVYVAEIRNKIVGMIIGQLIVSVANGGYCVQIEDLCIRKGLRKKGVKDSLLNILESWGKKRGSTGMLLVTGNVTHERLSFYRKYGFTFSRLKGFGKTLTGR